MKTSLTLALALLLATGSAQGDGTNPDGSEGNTPADVNADGGEENTGAEENNPEGTGTQEGSSEYPAEWGE